MIQIDMEMPENCDKCPMCEEDYGDCVLLKSFSAGWIQQRRPDCPLREVEG